MLVTEVLITLTPEVNMYMYYVPDLDILHINLYTLAISNFYHMTKELDVGIRMDLNNQGNPISIQILEASEKYPLVLLQKMDWSLPLISAEEAGVLLGDKEVKLLTCDNDQGKVSPKDLAMILQNRRI